MTEHEIQRDIIKWAVWGMRDAYVAAVPNGGYRHVTTAKKLKAEGVKAGVADLFVILPAGRVAWVEVKKPKGRQNAAQKEFQSMCDRLGHTYTVVHSLGEFIDFFKNTYNT